MKIEVLGRGCVKCNLLHQMVLSTLAKLGQDAEVVKINDIRKLPAYGVWLTPGLVVDGEVKVSGRLPSEEELEEWLSG
ncbi:MAG: TM0996/MTH895 family glutaredoxin-like protein [Desulfomonile tiedjei]|uniref:TM0996/MTH895 family glutaredoxin-like protein n=1 Tax=Desulfomonile tiedjei TaxID=2358 RepID=A0A9D6Z012_9BACT|nr:TM0996/MTH895 family glutaredoxin-like protein [Desulfomonile tiedjei]